MREPEPGIVPKLLLTELIQRPAERWMLTVLDLGPVRRAASPVRPVPMLGGHPHQAGVAKQVRTNLALFEVGEKIPSTRLANSLARLVLRIDSGSLRISSPSLTGISKA